LFHYALLILFLTKHVTMSTKYQTNSENNGQNIVMQENYTGTIRLVVYYCYNYSLNISLVNSVYREEVSIKQRYQMVLSPENISRNCDLHGKVEGGTYQLNLGEGLPTLRKTSLGRRNKLMLTIQAPILPCHHPRGCSLQDSRHFL
jgi:hypothetical protein